MKNKLASVASLCALSLGLLQAAPAQSPGVKYLGTAAESAPNTGKTPLKYIASVQSKSVPGGSQIMINSDSPLGDYLAYRRGGHFYVMIPQSNVAPRPLAISGDGFTNSKVERQGNDLLFSFTLEDGASVNISQKFNRLEVVFRRAGDSSAAAEAAEKPTLPANAVAKFVTPGSLPVATAPAVLVRQGASGDKINDRDVDLSVPESPAFTVLGVTPETVVRPTNPREFATSLLNGVDQNGNFQTGLALDFVPYLTFKGRSTSLSKYADSRVDRFLARTQFSFATTKGATDEDKSTKLALGLRLTLFDKGDPRLDDELDKCYEVNVDNDPRLDDEEFLPLPGETEAQKDAKRAKRKKLLAELAEPCNDAARKRNWNNSAWIVGFAPSWISKTGQTKNFEWNGGGFWTSIGYGFEGSSLENNSQLLFHARYRNNESVADPDNEGQFFSQDSIFLGSRLRVAPGEEAKSIFSLEGNFVRSRRDNNAYDNSSRYSLGLEQRVADNIWFALSLGGQSGRADGRNNAFVLTSFKWGFTRKE